MRRKGTGQLPAMLVLLLFACISAAVPAKPADASAYFNVEFHTPKKCELDGEPGVQAFLESDFPH